MDIQRLYVAFEVEKTAQDIFRALASGEDVVGVHGGVPAGYPARFFELFAPAHLTPAQIGRTILDRFPDARDLSTTCARFRVILDAPSVGRSRAALLRGGFLVLPVIPLRNGRATLRVLGPSGTTADSLRTLLAAAGAGTSADVEPDRDPEAPDRASGPAPAPRQRRDTVRDDLRRLIVPALSPEGELFAPVASLGIDPEIIADWLDKVARSSRGRPSAEQLPSSWFDGHGLTPREFKGLTTTLFTALAETASDLARTVSRLGVAPAALAAVVGRAAAALGLETTGAGTAPECIGTMGTRGPAAGEAVGAGRAAELADQELGE